MSTGSLGQGTSAAAGMAIGVNNEFGHSGPAAALLKQFGLSAEHIIEAAKQLCY